MKRLFLITFASLLLAGANVALNSGCAASGTHQSTGEYIDDAAITTKVKSAFATDDTVRATGIHVDTRDAVVYLSGFAHSDAEKSRAEQIARGTAGVKGVVNNIALK